MPSAVRRATKEFERLRQENPAYLTNIVIVDEHNVLYWEALLLPSWEPYKDGAFKISINIPKEYPFKPPILTFLTKIYHPNVDEKGEICLGIISAANWKPSVSILQVVKSLVDMINKPEPDHPLRGDLAEEYTKKPEEFKKKAKKFTTANALKRPAAAASVVKKTK